MNVVEQWSKTVTSIDFSTDVVKVQFDDNSTCVSNIVVGCDGIHSRVRKSMFPETWRNDPLPCRMLGLTATYSQEAIQEIRNLDSFFLHGSDPAQGVYFWFSCMSLQNQTRTFFLDDPAIELTDFLIVLDVPTNYTDATDGTDGKDGKFTAQILLSWPYRAGSLGREEPVEVPASAEERLNWIKLLSRSWADPFRSLVQSLSTDVEMKRVHLEDWVPRLDGAGLGKLALVGDSGHSMTMCKC